MPVPTNVARSSVPREQGPEGEFKEEFMGSRVTWPQICRSDEFRGRWVALDRCKYDPRTAQPTEGTVVDADEDLVALCSRMQASDSKHCAILFCDDRMLADDAPPPSARTSSPPPPTPPRAYH
jgi:hypothetical protein